MMEIILKGNSLERIRENISAEWSCSPEELEMDVIEKPGVFNRSWKVKVILRDKPEINSNENKNILITSDETKYTIIPGKITEKIVPFPPAGRLYHNGKEITDEFNVLPGVILEFYPECRQGGLSWEISVDKEGKEAVARVKHYHSGRYVLMDDIPELTRLALERFIIWEASSETEDIGKEQELQNELAQKGIIYGVRPNIWVEFLTVDGIKEIVIAEYTPPVNTVQPELIDYLGEPVSQNEQEEEAETEKIDYFACKLRLCEKDEVLARKVPGKEGTPGIDVFGNTFGVDKLKDFTFILKKNAYLSEDGLEVRAACSGIPVRIDKFKYLVENAYLVNKDVDLSVGSIEFPGDVLIGGNVNDGFFIHSGGKIQIQGSVSRAELKAEAGLKISGSIIASKVIIGEKHVFRRSLVQSLQDINEELGLCINQVEQLQEVSKNPNVGQLLKIILEKNFVQLPRKAEELEKNLVYEDPEFVTEELKVAVRTLKHFLVGLGPLQLKNILFLKNSVKIIEYFLRLKGNLIPASVMCDTTYVQNSEINCSGDFLCGRGVYNSIIKAEGNIKINGVCRGGETICSGDIFVRELGGSSVSSTTVRAAKNSRMMIQYCHSNVNIYVGKEIIRIDENVRKLDIYRDRGILVVEKLKWDGLLS